MSKETIIENSAVALQHRKNNTELVHAQIVGSRHLTIRVFIDKPGATHEDCSFVSRGIDKNSAMPRILFRFQLHQFTARFERASQFAGFQKFTAVQKAKIVGGN